MPDLPARFAARENHFRAARKAATQRVWDVSRPDGKPIGEREPSTEIRIMLGGLPAKQRNHRYLSVDGTPMPS